MRLQNLSDRSTLQHINKPGCLIWMHQGQMNWAIYWFGSSPAACSLRAVPLWPSFAPATWSTGQLPVCQVHLFASAALKFAIRFGQEEAHSLMRRVMDPASRYGRVNCWWYCGYWTLNFVWAATQPMVPLRTGNRTTNRLVWGDCSTSCVTQLPSQCLVKNSSQYLAVTERRHTIPVLSGSTTTPLLVWFSLHHHVIYQSDRTVQHCVLGIVKALGFDKMCMVSLKEPDSVPICVWAEVSCLIL